MQPEITRRLLVTAAGIVVLFLGLLGFTRLMRIVVRITGKAIVLELGEDPAVHAFGDIDSCEIGKTQRSMSIKRPNSVSLVLMSCAMKVSVRNTW